MTNREILDILKELFPTVLPHVDMSAVTLESDLFTDLGMDSLSLLLTSLAIENRFNIRITPNTKFTKVGDVVDYIQKVLPNEIR